MTSDQPSSAVEHKNNFDLIRLLAALQVTYTHGVSWLELPPLNAQIHQAIVSFPGVAVFFGVSGFLISRSYLKPHTTLLAYAESRALRIYPGLWVNILALVAMIAIAGNFLPGFFLSGPFFLWLAQVLVTGSNTAAGWLPPGIAFWSEAGAYQHFPSGVLWTLTIELLFYALVPLLLAKALVRRNFHFVTVGAAFALSLAAFWTKDLTQGPGYIDDYLWVFLIGAVINLAWPVLRPILDGKAALWLAAYLAIAFWRGTSSYQDATIYAVGMTILLVMTTISFAYTWKGLSAMFVKDDLSYGVYLWHMPVIWTMTLPAPGWVGAWHWYFAAMAATFAIALVVRVLIEKPALKLKIRMGQWRLSPAE